MTRIYVDTTRLIDFYEVADDKIVQIEQLIKHKTKLVLTEQTLTEFRRRRVQALIDLSKGLKKTIDDDRPKTVAIVQRLEAFKDLTRLYKAKAKEIFDFLQKLIDDEKEDPVAQQILGLSDDPTVIYLPLTDTAIDQAKRRKLLGNPPSSPDKYTIGDEVIWELLLAGLTEDLIVVTRDATYHQNFPLLNREYQRKSGNKLLLVAEKLSEALAKVGAEPAAELIQTEIKEQDAFQRYWSEVSRKSLGLDKLLQILNASLAEPGMEPAIRPTTDNNPIAATEGTTKGATEGMVGPINEK
jgi:hypothetical protein